LEHLKASLFDQFLYLRIGEQIVIAIQRLASFPPRDIYFPPLEPEPGLPPVPYGDKGFATGFQHPPQFIQGCLPLLLTPYMVVGSHRDCPVKGLVSIGKMPDISQRQTDGKIKFLRVFSGKFQHLTGKVNAIEVKALNKGQEIRTVSTANIQKLASLPSLSEYLQFATEPRPVPEVIPARGYLIKNIYYYLTPLIPLSFEGEGEDSFKRGFAPS